MPPPISSPVPHLDLPFSSTTLLQIRTSLMKPMRNLSILTGIYKQPRHTRVFCSLTGLDADEHDLTFHGGKEKAVHQYFSGHYEDWRRENPGREEEFVLGGFGENLVTGRKQQRDDRETPEHEEGMEDASASGEMNERNICIGDIIRVGRPPSLGGDGVLLQVCLPRQPCFKLNHRFGIKGFADQTWQKSRTGWYYRVLEEGWMEVGDEVVLVERKHPAWTIERTQQFLNRDKANRDMLRELATIEDFGAEAKKRIASLLGKLDGGKQERVKEVWSDWTVTEKTAQTKRITSFVLTNPDGGATPGSAKIEPGSFVRLQLPNGLIRPYSIVRGTPHSLELGIALDDNSRGGSRYMHASAAVGATIAVGKITASVPVKGDASHHIFIVGGVGVTAFMAHWELYARINFNFEVHFAVRDAGDVPFRERLDGLGSRLRLYDGTKGERMDLGGILKGRQWNSFVYVCGPGRMVTEVRRIVDSGGLGRDEVHFEAFAGAKEGAEFEVVVGTGEDRQLFTIARDKSLLDVLRDQGFDVESSCEVGNCGSCRVRLCQGMVEHRGQALTEEEKEEELLTCVSRGVGRIVIDF